MAGPLNWFSQVLSVTKISLHTILERKGSSAAAAFGIAGVVAVLVGVLSIAQGFRRTLAVSGSPDTIIVVRAGSDSEMMSGLTGEEARIIEDGPGIARGPNGPLASAELFVVINIPKRSTGTDANVPLRGVSRAAFDVRDGMKLVAGRQFEPGRNEVVVGVGAAREFQGLDLGGKFKVGRNEWHVVGMFAANGGVAESEIWTDAAVLQAAYERGNSYQSVTLRLTSPDALDQLRDALTTDPRLKVKVVRLSDFYADQSAVIYSLITGLGTLIASLMAVGAVFGALNTMYTTVSARTREIATLRALGFGSGPVVISVLLESLVLALAGGTVGAVLAWIVFDGFQTSTMNWQSFSQVAFAFEVSPGLLARGILYATLIGLIGGVFPGWRAARMPVASALRSL